MLQRLNEVIIGNIKKAIFDFQFSLKKFYFKNYLHTAH